MQIHAEVPYIPNRPCITGRPIDRADPKGRGIEKQCIIPAFDFEMND